MYLFTYVIDGCGLALVKVELFMHIILSLTGSDRKEGASHASLAQREMFTLKAEHSRSPSCTFVILRDKFKELAKVSH